MRPFPFISLLFVLSALPHALPAQGSPPAWAGQGQHRNVDAATVPPTEMAALEQFLRMSEEQLAAMAAAVDRVRKMSPQERRRLEKQIAAYRRLPAAQREQIRSGWISEDDWADWRALMQELTPEERSSIQNELQAMPFEKRAAHKHALLENWRAEKGTSD